MQHREPRPVSGSSRQANWMRQIWHALRANKILPGRGYRVKQTSNGTLLEIDAGGPGGIGSTRLLQCKITTAGATGASLRNYVGVKKWDGSDYVGDEFQIAKSIPSRMPTTLTIEGAVFNYAYSDDNNRTSTAVSDSSVEIQVLCPEFIVGDIIWVAGCDHTDVTVSAVELTYIEINTEREWVKRYAQ